MNSIEEFIKWHIDEYGYHPHAIDVAQDLQHLSYQREKGWQASRKQLLKELSEIEPDFLSGDLVCYHNLGGEVPLIIRPTAEE